MKRLFSISFLSLLLLCVCALSSKAEVQSDRTLYVYVQSVPSTIGTIRFASPAVKTASFRDNAIIKMDDYLYVGTLLLDFDVSGINASKITITCYDINYTKTIPFSSHVQETIPLPSPMSTSVYITFSN